MRVDNRYQTDILTDSTASLVTEGLLGNRYVNITRGFTGAPIGDAGVIPGAEEKAMKEVVERSAEVLGNRQGTLGKLVASDEMYTKVDEGLDNVNVILADVRAQKGTIGKLMYDPTLYDQAKQAITNGNAMIGDVRAGKGTFGKLATDDTLYNKLRDTSSNLAAATAKLNDNTTTAGKLFSDPKLYDNLTNLTGDMRLLIGDFRKNPKKFLHIKITLF